jgi:hypothetical protein
MNLKRVNRKDLCEGKKYLIYCTIYDGFQIVYAEDYSYGTIVLTNDEGNKITFSEITSIFELPDVPCHLPVCTNREISDWFDENYPIDK